MTKNKKILVGIVSLLPLISVVVYFIVFFNMITDLIPYMGETADRPPKEFFQFLFTIIICAVVMSMISLGLMIFYIIHSINNPYVSRDERIMWILLLIFLLVIAAPIYWYMRIWDTPHKEGVSTT